MKISNSFKQHFSIHFFGDISVLASALCFYFATVLIKISRTYSDIPSVYFVFGRFFLGFLVVLFFLTLKKELPVSGNKKFLTARALLNFLAVFLFFEGIKRTTTGQANMLNMTYPVFVAVFSRLFFKQGKFRSLLPALLLCFGGIILITYPGQSSFSGDSLFALGSGLTAAWSIIFLNKARQEADSLTVLFYMFGIGSFLSFFIFYPLFVWPGNKAALFVFLSALVGVLGQFLITFGFKHISALEGSILSSSRIFIAAGLGPLIFMEEKYFFLSVLGALLLFSSNLIVVLERLRKWKR